MVHDQTTFAFHRHQTPAQCLGCSVWVSYHSPFPATPSHRFRDQQDHRATGCYCQALLQEECRNRAFKMPQARRPCFFTWIKPWTRPWHMLRKASLCQLARPLLVTPLLVKQEKNPNKSPPQPMLLTSAAALLPAAILPKISTQAGFQAWTKLIISLSTPSCVQFQRGWSWFMTRGKLLAREAQTSSKTSRPGSEELRLAFPMAEQTATLLPAPRMLSLAWVKQLVFFHSLLLL